MADIESAIPCDGFAEISRVCMQEQTPKALLVCKTWSDKVLGNSPVEYFRW